MLTTEGATLLWEIAAGLSDDTIAGGSVAVTDGTQRAAAPLDAPPAVRDGTLVVTATFGENDANFTWASTEVLSAAGVVIDREASDSGRKAPGAIWTLETVLAFDNGEAD